MSYETNKIRALGKTQKTQSKLTHDKATGVRTVMVEKNSKFKESLGRNCVELFQRLKFNTTENNLYNHRPY